MDYTDFLHTTGQTQAVALSDIGPVETDSLSLALTDRQRLKKAIRKRGVTVPVYLTPTNASDGVYPPFRVVSRHSLAFAAQQANLEEIPAIICTAEDVSATLNNLVREFQRAENPMKMAQLCRAMELVGGLGASEIASHLDVSRSTVYRYLNLLSLPDALKALVASGKLDASHALACAEAPEDKQVATAQVGRDWNLSTRQIEDLVGLTKRHPDKPVTSLAEEIATARTSREAAIAERRDDDQPTEQTPIDYQRYTTQLDPRRQERLAEIAARMGLDNVTVRRAALLLLADPRLVVPSAVAYARQLNDTDVGRALTLVELGVERLRLASDSLTPSQTKTATLVLHHISGWARELVETLRGIPVAVRAKREEGDSGS